MTNLEIKAIIRFMVIYDTLCIGLIALAWYKINDYAEKNKLKFTRKGKLLKYAFLLSMICSLSYASNWLLNSIISLH